MDFRQLAIANLSDMAEQNPDLGFGDILYTILREKHLGFRIPDTHNLSQVGDEKWYEITEKAAKDEKIDIEMV